MTTMDVHKTDPLSWVVEAAITLAAPYMVMLCFAQAGLA
jgi:hypothetical protein